MLENAKERRGQTQDALPYNPQDWNRRLAEARARRAATLRERDARREGPATPSERLAAAWEGDRDALAVVTMPIAAPPAEVLQSSAAEAGPDPSGEAARSSPSPRSTVTLLAGCLIGSSLTGLLFLASGADWRPEPAPPSAAALVAATPDAPREESATTVADVDAVPPETAGREPPARTARADAAVSGDSAAPPAAAEPAEVAAAVSEWTPASAPARSLAVPDMVNAPQVQSPTDAVPVAPASIARVVILAPRSVSRAGREEAAALLREAGWPARDPATSPFTISSTHVRYYHSGDREGAEQLAALLSAGARDFTSYSPRPPEGMIELWLAGRAPPRQPERQGPSIGRFLSRLAAALEGRG